MMIVWDILWLLLVNRALFGNAIVNGFAGIFKIK